MQASTLMEAAKGGRESGARTSSPSTRPSAPDRATASQPSGCVWARTMPCASGMLIILKAEPGGIFDGGSCGWLWQVLDCVQLERGPCQVRAEEG